MYQRLRIAAATLSAATAIVLSGHDVARCDIQRIDIKRSDVRAKRKGGITLTPIQCVQHCCLVSLVPLYSAKLCN
jgi:hypothetical protein